MSIMSTCRPLSSRKNPFRSLFKVTKGLKLMKMIPIACTTTISFLFWLVKLRKVKKDPQNIQKKLKTLLLRRRTQAIWGKLRQNYLTLIGFSSVRMQQNSLLCCQKLKTTRYSRLNRWEFSLSSFGKAITKLYKRSFSTHSLLTCWHIHAMWHSSARSIQMNSTLCSVLKWPVLSSLESWCWNSCFLKLSKSQEINSTTSKTSGTY